ncbi:hypothetical protein IFR04_007552 [Cadophora malorum]|uniref:GAF domain-containing protein n=1 Tax=Cadophora malorum TaxID=108018 RepID=A0A8H7TIB7_9HELO|nr:hypothetical protein IFR04_007552 [Cadophora malorum]
MVHADSSNFASGVTKEEAYKQVLEQAEALLEGFYVLDPKSSSSSTSKRQLILGPFQGKVACQTILFGRGVCGTAASSKETQLVPDVEAFPGHIACDGDSKSEIVVPILRSGGEGDVVAIIDIDCAELNGFDEVDQIWLEKLAVLLAAACDW